MKDYLSGCSSSGAIGGSSKAQAEQHFVERFLNSAARAQYVCADPENSQPDIRDMILDQLADGRIFVLDLAAGSGAGTIAILGLLCDLRANNCIPQFPLNVHIFGIDYSPDALLLYQQTLNELNAWLEGTGIHVELDSWPCDLRNAGDLSEILESFFDDAKKRGVNRFLSVLSAVSGLGQAGVEEIHKSLETAAIRLSHKDRESSWLWLEPSTTNNWLLAFMNAIRFALQKLPYTFGKKKESFEVSSSHPLLPKPIVREFNWQDPHQPKIVKSRVMVVGFRNE